MTEACEKCEATGVKLYPYWEWMLCFECRRIEREAERINKQDEYREDNRLFARLG